MADADRSPPTRSQARGRVLAADPDAAAAWDMLIARPIGAGIAEAVSNDLVRGSWPPTR